MRKSLNFLIATTAIVTGLAFTSALYAGESDGSKMDRDMMGQGGMMNMMGQMGDMMESCGKMMQSGMAGGGAALPNDQWRDQGPAVADENN
ncbi:MAG: hypothetical protein VCC99_09360 [Alphaproteobacteria bacterium]